jgi:arginine:agmatine antiporter
MNPKNGQGKLGPFLATMVVAGGMIGSGIFLLPASLAAFGSASSLGWLVAILGAALLAGVFSELAILSPGTGGLFAYIHQAFGAAAGFVAGVLYWNPIGNLPTAFAVTGYLSRFVPWATAPPGSTATTLVVVWLLIGANLIGPRFVARLGGWTLLFGLAPVLLVALGGWFYFRPETFTASWNVSGQALTQVVPRSAVIAFWAFLGIEGASVVVPLLRNPGRDVRIATFGGLLIAAAVYLSACTVVMGVLPASALAKSGAPFADAAAPLIGGLAAGALAVCAIIRASGALGSTILVTTETAESEAVLGQLRSRARPMDRRQPSTANTVCMGILMSLAVIACAGRSIARQFSIAADITVVLNMVVYVAVSLALWRLSSTVSPRRRRIRVRVLSVSSALFGLWMICASEPSLFPWCALAVVLALLAYVLIRWARPQPAACVPPTDVRPA